MRAGVWVSRAGHAHSSSSREEWSRAAERILLGAVPVALAVALAYLYLHRGTFAEDAHVWYWPAAWHVDHGLSPYALPANLAINYPAVGALVIAPLGFVSHSVSDWVATLVSIASIPLTLRILGVRDWRVLGAVMLWQPVDVGWETANLSLLIVLGLALIWHYRDRPLVAGTLLAVLVSIKPFVAPVAIWMLATRRYRALMWTVIAGLTTNALAWLVIGFDQISVYLHLLHQFTNILQGQGYGLISLALHLGISKAAGYALGVGAGIAVMAAAVRARGDMRDRVVFGACLVASVLVSPVVESHYVAVLIVTVALRRRSLSPSWLLPIALWVVPAEHPSAWQYVFSLVVCGLVSADALLERRGASPPAVSSVAPAPA